MAAAKDSAREEHTWHDDTPSGFLKLSAEIRNKIYCLTLVTSGHVTVKDLHPDEWQAEQEAGHATRTSYKTKDHPEDDCPYQWSYDIGNKKHCTAKDEQWKNAKVSYTLWRLSHVTTPAISMLALNRQTRAEAVPIFYGKNEIHFFSMSALLPFLKDRSELSLQSMQCFHFKFEISGRRSQKSRQEGWARAFTELPKLGHLNLQKLTIRICDPRCRYAWKLKLDTKLQRWVHEMANNFANLDMLGVMFDFSIMGEMTPDENVKEDSTTEKQLWEFLAPKMLKEIGDEPHDAHSLLKRRIREDEGEEDSCEEDSYEEIS